MCSCLHLSCSHILRVPQPGPEFLCEVHILADEIDVLLEGLMDKICRATGQTKEELQRELEMPGIEEDSQLESTSDETCTTTAAAEDEEVLDFFHSAQSDPILTRQEILLTPIHPPVSRPPPSTTTTISASTTVDHTDLHTFTTPVKRTLWSHFQKSTAQSFAP